MEQVLPPPESETKRRRGHGRRTPGVRTSSFPPPPSFSWLGETRPGRHGVRDSTLPRPKRRGSGGLLSGNVTPGGRLLGNPVLGVVLVGAITRKGTSGLVTPSKWSSLRTCDERRPVSHSGVRRVRCPPQGLGDESDSQWSSWRVRSGSTPRPSCPRERFP